MTHTEALTMTLAVLKSNDTWGSSIREAKENAIAAAEKALTQPNYRAVKTYHEGKPVYVAQQEPVGKFARFTDYIWREVTDGSAGVPLYTTPPQQEQNLNCKSVQARLATAWGYVKAQSQQEPVAWKETDEVECPVCKDKGFPWPKCGHITYLEPTPPQRTWVGLTEKEILECRSANHLYFYKAVEAKLKEKNT